MVALSGAIDAKTVVSFQNQLNAVRDRGISRFILDMENVKYVNSTGLGYLINLADSIQPQGGGVALVKVQPKVKIVFDMLGLNAFFNIYGSRKDALEHFAASPAAEVESVAPAPVEAEAVPAPTEPGTVACAGCRAALIVSEAGTYRCPRCGSVFTMQQDGGARFLPQRKLLQLQLTLGDAPECRDGLGHCVELFARRAGFSDDLVGCLREAVADTVEQIVENAYRGADSAACNVLLLTSDSQFEVRMADHGATLEAHALNARGQELFSLARQVMDTFEQRPHPQGGNLISMTKKVP